MLSNAVMCAQFKTFGSIMVSSAQVVQAGGPELNHGNMQPVTIHSGLFRPLYNYMLEGYPLQRQK